MIRAIVLAIALAAPSLHACEVRVSAAASLTDLFRDVSREFEKASNCRVILNLGASSTLATQIVRGAPVDLFVSADREKVDDLVKRGLALKTSVRTLASNELVIVVPSDSTLQITSIGRLRDASIRRIAMARPESVPAGIYARRYLERNALWRDVASKIIPTDNVRSALAAASIGEVDVAFVYVTDVRKERVRVAFRVPISATPDIRYVAAITTAAEETRGAEKLLSFLQSEKGRKLFAQHGFGVVK